MFLEENLIRIILIFFFIKIFSSYSCDSPDKNEIKHDGSNYHISFTIGTNLEPIIIIHKNNVIIISETARSILKKKKIQDNNDIHSKRYERNRQFSAPYVQFRRERYRFSHIHVDPYVSGNRKLRSKP